MLFEKSLPAKTLSEVPASITGVASTARLIEVLSRSTCRTVIQFRFDRVDCSNDSQYVGRPIIVVRPCHICQPYAVGREHLFSS